MLKEQYGDEWLEQKRADIMPNPARWLANGLINAYWRNKSGIEGIHAGEWEARPLLQRRITPMQEYTIVQKVAEGIVPSMHAIYNVVNKKSEDGRAIASKFSSGLQSASIQQSFVSRLVMMQIGRAHV